MAVARRQGGFPRPLDQGRSIDRPYFLFGPEQALLSQIVRIAGYDPTGAEEMPADDAGSRKPRRRQDPGRAPAELGATHVHP
jgi:hypothetical protein